MTVEKYKTCRGCGKNLPLLSYHKCSAVKDGRKANCKRCMSARQKLRLLNSKIRSLRNSYARKWNNSAAGMEYHRKYKSTDKYKAQERIRMSYPKNKLKTRARDAVNGAIRYGRLSRSPCMICGIFPAQAHHYKGYQKKNWMNVAWLCRPHHDKVEKGLMTLTST